MLPIRIDLWYYFLWSCTKIRFLCFYICNLQILWHSSISIPPHFPLAWRWTIGGSWVFESHPPSPTVKPQSLACPVFPVRLLNVRFWGWQIKTHTAWSQPKACFCGDDCYVDLTRWRELNFQSNQRDKIKRTPLLYIYGGFYLWVLHDAACVTPFSWDESFAYVALSCILSADSDAICPEV